MTIIKTIEYDHEKIRKYIHDLDAMGHSDTALRKPLFNMLKKELLIVQKAEEQTLYQDMHRQRSAETLVSKLEDENDTIRSLLQSISEHQPNSDGWHKDFKKLKQRVFAHFDKEEQSLIPKAARALPAEDVAEKFDDEKRALWKTSTLVEKVSAVEHFSKTVRAA